jgi:hypothetical protein
VIPIQSVPIRSITAPSRSQIVDKWNQKITCQALEQQCAEKSDKKCMESGDIFDRVHGWVSPELKAMNAFV